MNDINNFLGSVIRPFTLMVTAAINATARAFTWFLVNPVYTIIGFYVFMVALKGGNFKLGSKAQTSVKS